MPSNHHITTDEPGSGPSSRSEDYRHSKEDVLSRRAFVQLLDGARTLDSPYDFEARLCVYLAGKLGLRAGEIAHVETDWIDWHDNMIRIPEHEPCSKGSDGGICGYCRSRAEDRLLANNLTVTEAVAEIRSEFDADLDDDVLIEMALDRRDEVNMTYDAALAERWNPKTENSVRAIPFDFDIRAQMCIEEFADRYDGFPRSRATVNRRINRAADAAGIEERVYPHALRATSASFHASRDVSPYSLMSIMGWNDIQTARSYIRASDETAAKEIRSKHR